MKFKIIIQKDSGESFDESLEFLEADKAISFIKAYSALIDSVQQSVKQTTITHSPSCVLVRSLLADCDCGVIESQNH